MQDKSAQPKYRIVELDNISGELDYAPRGGCAEFMYSRDREVIAVGPAETGKTMAACWKIHLLAIKYPGLNGAIVRQTYRSMPGSVLVTYGRVIEGAGVNPLGGSSPERYIYPNGSQIWIGGMDNPDKVLSSERDFIYVNQAEEITEKSWEFMKTRTTGRGAVMPYTQLFGDCNPAGSRHWIVSREREGKLKLIQTTHMDNPALYTPEGTLTERGERTLGDLASLSGVTRARLFEGKWASVEGAVYDTFDRMVHVVERPRNEFKRFYVAADEGYTNPAVLLDVGEDGDGRWHVFREYYQRFQLEDTVVAMAAQWYSEYNHRLIAVDAAAAGLIANMRNKGLPAVPAKGRVLDGIQSIQNRLAVAGDGKPRLTFDPSCENAVNEFESYQWKLEKDEPVKADDHCPDAMRYLDDAYVHDPNPETGPSPTADYRG